MNNYDFVDDEFKVSSYIKSSIYTDKEFDKEILSQAEEYVKSTENVMILPVSTIDELEKQWLDFNSMIKHHRRESDWESIRLFGMTNEEHYNKIRSHLLSLSPEKDKDYINYNYRNIDSLSESYVDNNIAVDTYYNSEAIYYSEEDVEKAIQWGEESNRIIITPTRTLEELENLWTDFNSMLLKHRRESDWMSIEIFGISNIRHYEYLKTQFAREDLSKSEKEKFMTIPLSEMNTVSGKKRYFRSVFKESPLLYTKAILENALPKKGFNEELVLNNIISDILGDTEALTNSIPSVEIPHGDVPYLSPEDMVDMGVFGQSPADNYYGVLPDNEYINDTVTVAEWFKMYKNMSYGSGVDTFNEMASSWVNKVRELMFGLKKIEESGDIEAINARKQSILELGWYPEIEFDETSRSIARDIAINRISSRANYNRFVDLKEFITSYTYNEVLNENNAFKDLKPVYIVLSSGKSRYSEIIKKATRSIYSHASVSFDDTLEKLYTFGGGGVKTTHNSPNEGFIVENIKNVDSDINIAVYTFFVSNRVYDKLKSFVLEYEKNRMSSSYSYNTLITNFFQIKTDRGRYRMVCSQFVDSFLKSADIDITGKDSSIVSPGDIERSVNSYIKSNRNIYELYIGTIREYKYENIRRIVKSLLKTAAPLKEQYEGMSERAVINYLINNINDISVLKEIHSTIRNISNNNVRDLVEATIYKNIYAEAYADDSCISENYNCNTIREYKPSVSFVSDLITKYMNPIV